MTAINKLREITISTMNTVHKKDLADKIIGKFPNRNNKHVQSFSDKMTKRLLELSKQEANLAKKNKVEGIKTQVAKNNKKQFMVVA